MAENGRESITITIKEVSPQSVGRLIALFERAVGFYASLVNINAYNQPGVEAGKKAAGKVIDIQSKILNYLSAKPGKLFTLNEISHDINMEEDIETYVKGYTTFNRKSDSPNFKNSRTFFAGCKIWLNLTASCSFFQNLTM